jgi:PAS domain S-box-containing protein
MISVLFVDDDPEILALTRKFLERGSEMQVDTSTSAQEALTLLRKKTYDAVISDYSMPEMGGSRFLQQMRADGFLLPVIIFTGKDRKNVLIEVLNTGADFFLQKGGDLNEQFIELASIIRQAVQRWRAEGALKKSDERFRILAENARDMIYRYMVHPVRCFEYVSPSATVITGYTPEDLYADPDLFFSMVHPNDLELVAAMVEASVRSTGLVTFRWIRKDGIPVWIELQNVQIIGSEGRVVALEGVARDISERKRMEEEVLKSLHEKEMLLREIHHRVKNNLQVISSLLYLQSLAISDPQTLAFFNESRDRIRSIALVHENLCRSSNLSRINFGEYLDGFISHLKASFGARTCQISFQMEVDRSVELGIDEAIACGLIVNELVSNAMKYAFDGGGAITIGLHTEGEGRVVLIVMDNGRGLPEQVTLENPPGLGLQLVKNLVVQLSGEATIGRYGGTRYTISFSPAST